MSEPPLLEVQGLCAYYGRSQALFDVALAAPRRGAVAVLGRNGAGKTTLLKSIVGELRPERGSVRFDGEEVSRTATDRLVRRGLGYVPQEHAAFGRLSVRENLEVGALHARDGGVDRALSLFPKLADRLQQQAGTLSGGERKMLAIARALVAQPRLLLLDEPTEGVWIGVIEEIAERLHALAREIALVVVEQHLDLALSVADAAYVLDRGRVALQGPAARIREDPQLLRYLAP